MPTIRKNEPVFCGHVFRPNCETLPSDLPKFAPVGKNFYIVTPDPIARNRKYLYELKRTPNNGNDVKLSPIRHMAKKFDNLMLAESFCSYLCAAYDVKEDYWIVLE